jgi:cytochrome c biogenesis protein
MKAIVDLLTSVKLTLFTLLGLAIVSVGGTIWPVEQGMVQRFELYYQSLWFRALLAILAVNLAACTWRTFSRVLGEKKRLKQLLEDTPAGLVNKGEAVPNLDLDEISHRLQEQGYRTTRHGQTILARKGVSGRWSLPILHLSILAVMLGALASQLGFVGTMNLYVTHQSENYFDWDTQGDKPLGFTFRLDHFEPRYYPIDLRFAIYDKQSKEQLQEFTTKEGETVAVSPELSLQVLRFFPEEEHLVVGILRNGVLVGEHHSLSGKRTYPNSIDPGFVIKPTAYRDPLLKQLHSQVTILENGREVRQGVIEVNTPLIHRGVAIYQTAYNRDESGFWTCGFQVSKDPGEGVVWVGSIVLSLALFLVFLVRFRALGVVSEGEGLKLIPLTGFRGDRGQEQLADVAAAVKTSPGS